MATMPEIRLSVHVVEVVSGDVWVVFTRITTSRRPLLFKVYCTVDGQTETDQSIRSAVFANLGISLSMMDMEEFGRIVVDPDDGHVTLSDNGGEQMIVPRAVCRGVEELKTFTEMALKGKVHGGDWIEDGRRMVLKSRR